jgi:Ca-activated chloride channel homolog
MRAVILMFSLLVAASPAAAIGLLVPTDPSMPPLRLVSHRVEAKVVERGAVTKVIQEFDNPTDRQLEATFLFPLPKGATIDEFALWMNGKREVGKVMERKQARAIYESIVRRSRDPGLIEYVDAELFQANVFPIPPRGRQKIELTFSHLVDYEGGLYRYVYPMKTDQRATSTLEDFTFTVRIESKAEIKNLVSPTHKMATQKRGKGASASLEKNAFSLADDLSLYWSVDDGEVGLSVLTYKEGDEAGYFMLLASPKDGFRTSEIIGKRVAFVVDTSGSMEGEKMEATKRALDQCLGKLGEDDLFSIVTFGGYAEPWKDKMVAASRANVDAARAYVRKLEPLGGTNIDEALQSAFATATGSEKAPLMIVFMTDGRPTVGETDVAKILARANAGRAEKKARIFVLGVGDDLNALLLDKMSTANGGSALYLKGNSALEAEVASFYDKISHPVLADLSLSIDGVHTFGNHPRTLGDLFAGQQLVVLGRYRDGGKATIKLSGSTPKGARMFTNEVSFASTSNEHGFIPRLWAQRQVGMLLDEIREKGETKGLVDEVTQLATRFGIVTPYTSYLVVEPTMATPPPPDDGRFDRRSVVDFEETGAFDSIADSAPSVRGGSGGAPAAAPAKPADEGMFLEARKKMRSTEGKDGIGIAKELGKLKGEATLDKRVAKTTSINALGRVFTFKDGFFVDPKSKPSDATFTIRAFSDAYFLALKLRPDLKPALAAAEQLRVSVGAGKTLIVSSTGPDKIDDAKLKSFLDR